MTFFPQATQVILPADLSANLNWKELEVVGDKPPSVLWYLDFSFQTTRFSPHSSMILQSQIVAVEHFCQTIWNLFKANTAGVILYQGTTDFSSIFPRELWSESFLQWLEHLVKGPLQEECILEHYYELYTTQLFAELMQRLLAFLPEDCPALLLIEASESLAFLAQKFSLERFESFILLDPERRELPFLQQCASLGICLPADLHCDQKTLKQINSTLAKLQERHMPFRFIPESKLHHFWNGLDEILVFSKTLSIQGKRQLLGFCATGGRVIVEGEALCLPQEISLENFLQISQSF